MALMIKKKRTAGKSEDHDPAALIQNATIGIITVRDDGIIELANPFALKLFGYENEGLTGKPLSILIPEFLREKHSHRHSEYFKHPKARPMGQGIELSAQKKDGTFFPVDISLNYYQSNGKRLALAYIIDVTEQKQNLEQYKNLFENSLAAMFITDLKTLKIVDVNEPGVKLFGYKSKTDLIINYNSTQHVVNPEEREENIAQLREGDGVTREMELKKLDGSRFWVKLYIKVNRDRTMAQSIIIDVTEAKVEHEKLETKVKERTLELANALEHERELNDMKSRFVTMASHEFRTPLSAILSSIFLIESSNNQNQRDKIEKHSKRIKTAVKNLTDILNDFLSLEKLEQGKVDIYLEPFQLPEFLKEIVDEFTSLLKPGQHLIFSHKGAVQIVQDKRILRNAIFNLLSNAIKYTPERKKIYLTSEVAGKKVCITVKDEGIGIPEDEQKKIFGKFFRAKNATNIQGTGLGLNIVKRYVELINAEIKFNSTLEIGSEFTIEFHVIE